MMNINKLLIRLFFGICFLQFFCDATAQNVSNVYSRKDGKKINIFYTLDKTAYIAVFCSTDGGKTFGNALQKVSGDVGKDVTSGNNTIVWDVLSECDKLNSENVVFEVRVFSTTYTVNGVSFEMIAVEGGTFTMGCTNEQGSDCYDNESPFHRVTLSNYSIGKYEVTQELWQAVMGSNPSRFKGNNLPVESVSWNDVQQFITKLNQLTGQNFRLPTEAEWEYAARGGNKTHGYEYSGSNTKGNVAWYYDNSSSKTHPVGTKSPNELGIYDMSGNVWEWCQDWYGSYSSGSQTNPTGASSGSYRVYRGGSWNYDAWICRVSLRLSDTPDYRIIDLGFRRAASPQ